MRRREGLKVCPINLRSDSIVCRAAARAGEDQQGPIHSCHRVDGDVEMSTAGGDRKGRHGGLRGGNVCLLAGEHVLRTHARAAADRQGHLRPRDGLRRRSRQRRGRRGGAGRMTADVGRPELPTRGSGAEMADGVGCSHADK